MKVIKSDIDGDVSYHIVEATDAEYDELLSLPPGEANAWIESQPPDNIEYIDEYPLPPDV